MAGAGGTMTTPLRLKDLLELDCESCSAAGFRCYPRRLGESSAPAQYLLESSSPSLRRRPSKLSHLSRSLSRRLSRRGGFWRRRDDEEHDAAAAPTATTATAVSAGCGGSSSEEQETSSESSDNSSERTIRRSRSRTESDSDFSSAATEDTVHHPSQAAAAAGDEHEQVAMKRVSSKDKEGSSSGSEADDKEQEQLSPVAVMDFPFDDDDELTDAGGACSPPSFSLARLQRRKTRKIRRFGSRDELAPLDLEAGLAATSTDPDGPAADAVPVPAQQMMIQCRTEGAATPTCASSGGVHDVRPDEGDLISLLMGTVPAGLDHVSERLLLDFVVETRRRRRPEAHAESSELLPGPPAVGLRRRKAERPVDGEAVAAARGWLEDTGTTERWGLKDVLSGGAAIVAEMERGRRWMQVGQEEREVGVMVAGMLLDQLVAEVVRCLFV